MKSFFRKIIQFYLKLLTKFVLWRHKPFIIAVSGSTNKTTVKDYILKFLREEYGETEVRGNPKSYNTEIGLPLAILYLESGNSSVLRWLRILARAKIRAFFGRKFPSKLVLELGVENKGDMDYLLGIIRPAIGIITNIEGSYTYSNSGLETIFEEMEVLAKNLPENGYLLLNSEDARVMELAKKTKAKVIAYGLGNKAEARAENVNSDARGQTFDFAFRGRKESVRIKKYGLHNVYAWMAAKVVKNIL